MVRRAGFIVRTGYNAKRQLVQGGKLAYRAVKYVARRYPNIVNAAVAAGVNTAIGYMSSGTQTDTKKGSGTKRIGSNSYMLAGKVKSRMTARRYYRKGKRRTRKSVKKLYRGVALCKEYASTGFGDKCIYIGTCTNPMEETFYLLGMACFKAIMLQRNYSLNDWNQARSPVVSNGDIFQFVYKPHVNGLETAVNASITVVAGHVTYWDILSNLLNNMIGNMKLSGIPDGIILTQFQLISSGVYHKVDLQDANLSFYSKVSFKMQNRSVAKLGDDEVDVNNVPVQGKIYEGYGNGAVQRTANNFILLNGESVLNPIAIDGSTLNNFSEPPNASEFSFVTKSGKVYINPGSVKTGVISYKRVMNITKLMQMIVQFFSLTASNLSRHNLGRFQFFAIERVISKLVAEETPAISVTFEVDWKGYATLYPNPQTFTCAQKITF